MRALNLYSEENSSQIAGYATKMVEALAVRRAANAARTARLEAELSIRARSEFLANMNHELRTPLNAIIGFATMLHEGETYKLGEEQQSNYAEYILQSADLLLAHINTILETAELDGGDISLNTGVIDLTAELAKGVDRARIAADAGNVSIENKTGGDPILAWGDLERTAQSIDHIIRTAVKLSPENGRILVRAVEDSHGWVEIAVRDRSEGLAPDALSKVLNVFDEVHRGLDRSFEGPGVGLAIAKTFVEMQGGRFTINSRVGEGTLVQMAFPPPKEEAGAPVARQLNTDNKAEIEAAPIRARMAG